MISVHGGEHLFPNTEPFEDVREQIVWRAASGDFFERGACLLQGLAQAPQALKGLRALRARWVVVGHIQTLFLRFSAATSSRPGCWASCG